MSRTATASPVPRTLASHLDRPLLSDGGLETTLVYHHGIDLPCFAAFPLLGGADGRALLRSYYERYLRLARAHGFGFVLESPTWRANRDWGRLLGYDDAALDEANRTAIALMHELRAAHADGRRSLLVSGNLGPRGDGYRAEARMDVAEAAAYHRAQLESFARSGVDLVSAFTLTTVAEAQGICQVAAELDLPAVISFTVETDGRLPGGETLAEAITQTDAAAAARPAWYMVNCAHPSHFADTLGSGAWRERVRGVRANASRASHAELDRATTLDDGDPRRFGRECAALRERLPRLAVLGGCCGTDHRHVAALAAAWRAGADRDYCSSRELAG